MSDITTEKLPEQPVAAVDSPETVAAAETPAPPVELPRRSFWRDQAPTALLAGVVAGVVAALVSGGVVLGVALALRHWGVAEPGGPGTLQVHWAGKILVQKGKVTVPAGGKVDVYYPASYQNPPQLIWSSPSQNVTVVDQNPDYFVVHSNAQTVQDLEWTAEGVPSPEAQQKQK